MRNRLLESLRYLSLDLSIAIFSYNRGKYVKNCLESIASCCPDAVVTIYDDDSTDTETVSYLKGVSCKVVNSHSEGRHRHGGLYGNMQIALKDAKSKYILFLQDDTQLVRRVDKIDLELIDTFFRENREAAFINPVFLKGHRRRSIDKQLMPQLKFRGYYQEISEVIKPRPVSMFYCDVVLVHVDRLKLADWCFLESETNNAHQASKRFSKMLQLADPFVMHVPQVPVFRGKKSTVGSRLAEKVVGCDVKAFQIMADLDVEKMRERSLNLAPYAEDYLNTINSKVRKPYSYNAINARWYTRFIHKLEYGIYSLFK